MANEIKGTIHRLFDTKQVSDKFSKRELVITTEGKYPQMLLVQVTNDKIKLLDDMREGDEVSAALDIRGREWRSPSGEVKYFVTLECWKIERTSQAQSRGGSHEAAPPRGDNPIPF